MTKGKNMFDKYKNLTPEECAKTIKKEVVASLFFNEATTYFLYHRKYALDYIVTRFKL